jgi:hypothetical protein
MEKNFKEIVKHLSDKLNNIEKISGIASWTWNITNGEIEWSAEIYKIFGLNASDFKPTYDKFLESIAF